MATPVGPAHRPAQQTPSEQGRQRGDLEGRVEDGHDELDAVPDAEELHAEPEPAGRPTARLPRVAPTGSARDLESALNAIGTARRRQSRRARTVPAAEARRPHMSASQRMLLLDTWRRSGLSGSDFASMVGVSMHTLYKWNQSFLAHGPAGLEDAYRSKKGESRLPEPTRRAILLLKQTHPDWGQIASTTSCAARRASRPAPARSVACSSRRAT